MIGLRSLVSLFSRKKINVSNSPLREFIYLDEVSLRSLLSSQKGEITDSTSNQTEKAQGENEARTVSLSIPQLAGAERSSSFQTSNSSSIQTSRKATVQSWFRELHNIEGIHLLRPSVIEPSSIELSQIPTTDDRSIVTGASKFVRGKLVEFRVKLSGDPVFRLGTMLSEFDGMAEDFPEMFSANNAMEVLKQAQPVNKVLGRLMAGLIPVRAEAIDYVVVEVKSQEYVVHRSALEGIELDQKPLELVGVTEHLAYWKDIRRVLFSDAEFTVLCRIGRDGLQSTWTPVKLADLFRDVAPGLVEQINTASKMPMDVNTNSISSIVSDEGKLAKTLFAYKALVFDKLDFDSNIDDEAIIMNSVINLMSLSETATDQREAFRKLDNVLSDFANLTVLSGDEKLALRDAARQETGLPLLPVTQPNSLVPVNSAAETIVATEPRLLDVEFIAIYW